VQTLQHPAALVAKAGLLGAVVEAGLRDHAADLLTVAALDLLAEQARTARQPELALQRAIDSAHVRSVLARVSGPDAVETCLAALRQHDLDILAAQLCLPARRSARPKVRAHAAA